MVQINLQKAEEALADQEMIVLKVSQVKLDVLLLKKIQVKRMLKNKYVKR